MLYQFTRIAGFFPTSENTFSLYATYGHEKDNDHAQPWFTRRLYRVTFDTQNPSYDFKESRQLEIYADSKEEAAEKWNANNKR
mgnify:CR=1 FL=1